MKNFWAVANYSLFTIHFYLNSSMTRPLMCGSLRTDGHPSVCPSVCSLRLVRGRSEPLHCSELYAEVCENLCRGTFVANVLLFHTDRCGDGRLLAYAEATACACLPEETLDVKRRVTHLCVDERDDSLVHYVPTKVRKDRHGKITVVFIVKVTQAETSADVEMRSDLAAK